MTARPGRIEPGRGFHGGRGRPLMGAGRGVSRRRGGFGRRGELGPGGRRRRCVGRVMVLPTGQRGGRLLEDPDEVLGVLHDRVADVRVPAQRLDDHLMRPVIRRGPRLQMDRKDQHHHGLPNGSKDLTRTGASKTGINSSGSAAWDDIWARACRWRSRSRDRSPASRLQRDTRKKKRKEKKESGENRFLTGPNSLSRPSLHIET